MKHKLPFSLSLALAFGLVAAVLAGRALIRRALPPTGSAQASQAPGPLSPDPARAALQSEDAGSWIETGRRWGIYREDAEWLEETEEPVETLIRLPAPAPSPLPAPLQRGHPQAGPLPATRPATPREPTIQEVQRAAIRYAEVTPEKISRWRVLAQMRNFIPRFTLGLDRDRDTTIASSTLAGKTNFSVGPKDESTSVDFGFTWDLANLVWDSAQTSIDVRSRLMVQLRQDILEEVTRLYFQRRRLQAEFEANPTEDPTLLRERSLRLEEIAAQLDAFTGGFYSDRMHKIN